MMQNSLLHSIAVGLPANWLHRGWLRILQNRAKSAVVAAAAAKVNGGSSELANEFNLIRNG